MTTSIFDPRGWLVFVLAALVFFGLGFVSGKLDGKKAERVNTVEVQRRFDRYRREHEQAAAKQATADVNAGQQASANYQEVKANAEVKTRTIVREVEKIVDRPVYRNICLDADGLRLANSAISGSVQPASTPR